MRVSAFCFVDVVTFTVSPKILCRRLYCRYLIELHDVKPPPWVSPADYEAVVVELLNSRLSTMSSTHPAVPEAGRVAPKSAETVSSAEPFTTPTMAPMSPSRRPASHPINTRSPMKPPTPIKWANSILSPEHASKRRKVVMF
jgi:hypothetical protein